MSKLYLSTKGIMEVFAACGVFVTVDITDKECIINASKAGHPGLQLITSIKSIDRRIASKSNISGKIFEECIPQMRINTAIRMAYQHVISEGMMDGLIPIDIAERHGYFTRKNKTTYDILEIINKTDCVYVEYKMKGIIPGMWEDEESIRLNTELIADSASLEGRQN